jgi:aquaporin Z
MAGSSLLAKSFGEMAGTFILISVILMITGKTSGASNVAVPIGLALVVAIYLFGDLTGGHFNPAVSLTMFMKNSTTFTGLMLLTYMVAQCIGGLSALHWNKLTAAS